MTTFNGLVKPPLVVNSTSTSGAIISDSSTSRRKANVRTGTTRVRGLKGKQRKGKVVVSSRNSKGVPTSTKASLQEVSSNKLVSGLGTTSFSDAPTKDPTGGGSFGSLGDSLVAQRVAKDAGFVSSPTKSVSSPPSLGGQSFQILDTGILSFNALKQTALLVKPSLSSIQLPQQESNEDSSGGGGSEGSGGGGAGGGGGGGGGGGIPTHSYGRGGSNSSWRPTSVAPEETIDVDPRENAVPSESGIDDLLSLLENDTRSGTSRAVTSDRVIAEQETDTKPIVEFFTQQLALNDERGYTGNAEFRPEIFSQFRLPEMITVDTSTAAATEEWTTMIARLVESYLSVKLGARLLGTIDEGDTTFDQSLAGLLATAPGSGLQATLSTLPEEIENVLSELHDAFDSVGELDSEIDGILVKSLGRVGYNILSRDVTSLGSGVASLLTGTKKFFSFFQDLLSTHFDMHPLINGTIPPRAAEQRIEADDVETEALKRSLYSWFPGNFWSTDRSDIVSSTYDRRRHNFSRLPYLRANERNLATSFVTLPDLANDDSGNDEYCRKNNANLPKFLGGTWGGWRGRTIDTADRNYTKSTLELWKHLIHFSSSWQTIPSNARLRGLGASTPIASDTIFLLKELQREITASNKFQSVKNDLKEFELAGGSTDDDFLKRVVFSRGQINVFVLRLLGRLSHSLSSTGMYQVASTTAPGALISLASLVRLDSPGTSQTLSRLPINGASSVLPFEAYDVELKEANNELSTHVSLRQVGVSLFLPIATDFGIVSRNVSFNPSEANLGSILSNEQFIPKLRRVQRILENLFEIEIEESSSIVDD